MKNDANWGRVVVVRGSVLDICFSARLPEPRSLLEVGAARLLVEVQSHLNAQTVRAIALHPTRGVGRGE